MSWLSSILRGQKKPSATVAKKRLMELILINERNNGPDYLPQLRQELVQVISRYVNINPEDIKVHLERQDELEVLEVKIEMPQAEGAAGAA